ncbi:MAG: hypothetical protein HY815_25620 [Candidatus Riflebacteria bacterium]|nr:hypothetical protein [Candidatus Riflebacteria bacterium]
MTRYALPRGGTTVSRLTSTLVGATGIFIFVWIVAGLGFGADCWWLLDQGASLMRDGVWPERIDDAFTVDPQERHAVLAALWVSRPLLFVRAETFTSVYFAVLLCVLESGLTGRGKAFLLLPLTVLWVNTHMSFLVGIGAILVHALGQLLESVAPAPPDVDGLAARTRAASLARIALLALVITGVNRYSYQLYEFILVHPRIVREFPLAHFLPPNFGLAEDLRSLAWVAVSLFALRCCLARRRPGAVARALLTLGLVAAWSQSSRFIAFVSLATLPVLGDWWVILAGLPAPEGSTTRADWRVVAGRAAVVALIAWELAMAAAVFRGRRTSYPETGVARIADRLAGESAPGNLFNDFTTGGFLVWHRPGAHRLFVDPRVTPYFRSGVLRDYGEVMNLRNWEEVFRIYEIGYALVDSERLFTRVLMARPDWEPIDRSGTLVLLRKRPADRTSSGK